ncbi:DUF4426 domain-containing protein [Pseudomonas sp. LRF_L74]|uniref:DUF4426 domain-containing protein n=1 Tax=Pseudomonas sp. LRF_L74 TaxID=3369422 RepID=UPI003F626C01
MLRTALLCLSLLFALPALAERKQTFGDLDVHYNVFNASFLQADVAADAGLTRGKNVGVVNLTPLKAGKSTPVQVSGETRDLLGKRTPLQFRQVLDNGTVSYIAEFPITQRDTLTFDLDVQSGGAVPNRVSFTQEVFPDE